MFPNMFKYSWKQKTKVRFKNNLGGGDQMADQEDLGLISPYEHIKNTSTHRAILIANKL